MGPPWPSGKEEVTGVTRSLNSVGVMVTRLPPKEKTAGSSPVRNV